MASIEAIIRDDNGNIISQKKGKEIDLQPKLSGYLYR